MNKKDWKKSILHKREGPTTNASESRSESRTVNPERMNHIEKGASIFGKSREDNRKKNIPIMSKYLEFSLIERKPKTKVIGVWSKKSADRLGIIKWFPGWRQYAFFPEFGTVFNMECLNEIISHIKEVR